MVALGLGLVWAGYASALYGYMLIRGYNVSPKQIFSIAWPPISPDKSPVAFTIGEGTSNGNPLGAGATALGAGSTKIKV